MRIKEASSWMIDRIITEAFSINGLRVLVCIRCCITCAHTPVPCLPVPAAPSWWTAWRGQRPSGPRRPGLHSAPPPAWRRCHSAETAPDAWPRPSRLAAAASVHTWWGLSYWRCCEDRDASERKEGKVNCKVRTINNKYLDLSSRCSNWFLKKNFKKMKEQIDD